MAALCSAKQPTLSVLAGLKKISIWRVTLARHHIVRPCDKITERLLCKAHRIFICFSRSICFKLCWFYQLHTFRQKVVGCLPAVLVSSTRIVGNKKVVSLQLLLRAYLISMISRYCRCINLLILEFNAPQLHRSFEVRFSEFSLLILTTLDL